MKARDEEFRDYVLASRGDLVRTATLLTAGDRNLAEDIVQSTLTQLYVAWPAFRRTANPRAYARRALVNTLVDEKRRPWRRRERPTADLPEPAPPGGGASARVDQLNQALGELPPRMRAALVFRYFHDLSVAETAAALSCSQGTVKSQTARALDRLRTVLDDRPAAPAAPSRPVSPATWS